jgi:hypothetical protein
MKVDSWIKHVILSIFTIWMEKEDTFINDYKTIYYLFGKEMDN